MDAREPLTRDRIVQAAIGLADVEGIEALSMRRLAAELGYEPMSLYNHIDNKDDLLARMVDQVVGEVDLPDREDCDWRTAMHAALVSSRDVLMAHPWAANIWDASWPGPNRKRRMDWLLGCLREAGFSVELTHHGFHAVELYVVGVVEQATTFAMPDDPAAVVAEFLAATPREQYPHLVEHVEYHRDEDTINVDDFDVLLDFILDGLERRRSEE